MAFIERGRFMRRGPIGTIQEWEGEPAIISIEGMAVGRGGKHPVQIKAGDFLVTYEGGAQHVVSEQERNGATVSAADVLARDFVEAP